MTTDYYCKDCLYYYADYIFTYKEGHNWCKWRKREVNPDLRGCNDFVLPTCTFDTPYIEKE